MKIVSLLRGINVGGHKKIKMADLKSLFHELGFTNVITYIQSGNVVFDLADTAESELISRIESGIENTFGFQVPVVLRTHRELEEVIESCPFGNIDAVEHGTKYSVTFLSNPPLPARADDLETFVIAPEELMVQGREVYLHYPNGTGRSKLTPSLLERKLGVTGTTRNWRSLLKLAELSS